MDPFNRIRLAEGLAKILLIYGAVFNTPLNGFSKLLYWMEITLIISKILS